MAGLDLAKAVGSGNVIVHCDSQVITSKINSEYECRSERMKKYLGEVKNQINSLEVKFVQIPREENEYADRLAKVASAEFMIPSEQVLSFVQISSLINDKANVQEVNSDKNWIAPLIAYLRSGILPDGKDAARKMKV